MEYDPSLDASAAPWEQIVLRKSRDMLTDRVQPRATMLPNAVEQYRNRAADLFAQGSSIYGQEPDMSQFEQYARDRASQSDAAMLNALAAQFAGESFQPVQEKFLKRALAAQEPMKLAGGVMTPDGKFLRDPTAANDKRAEFLMQQARAYEQLAQTAVTEQERAEARRLQNESMLQLKRLGLDIQMMGAQSLAALRAAQTGKIERDPGKTKERPLPWNSIKEFSSQAGLADAMTDLVDTFKPDFAGGPVLGNVQNALGRAGVGYADQSNWWQRYQEQSNLIRNELFGSALTATEKAAFDAANITPGMGAKQIETRLKQQAEAAQRAYNRLKDAAAGSGFDVKGLPEVRSLRTPSPANPTNPEPSAASKPRKRIRYDAEGNEIP